MSDLADKLKNGVDPEDALIDTEVNTLRRKDKAKRKFAQEQHPSRALQLLSGDGIMNLPVPKQLIAGELVQGSMAFVVADSGAGKTTYELGRDLAICCGLDNWLGSPIHPDASGQVIVYVLAEGAGFIKFRIAAYLQTWHKAGLIDKPILPESFILIPGKLQLKQDGGIDELLAKTKGLKPILYSIDTWQRHGGPESDENEMNAAIDRIDLIRDETGAVVNSLHHTPKDGRLTLRGHSSTDASADTVIFLKPLDDVIEVTLEQRDLAGSKRMVRRKVVPLDKPLQGHSACIIEPVDPATVKRATQKIQNNAQLQRAIIAAVQLTPGVNQDALCKAVGGNKAKAVAEIQALEGRGHLRKIVGISKKGTAENHFEPGLVPF